MKIYKDGEYAINKMCFNCRTEEGVFYDKRTDFFICNACLSEIENSEVIL